MSDVNTIIVGQVLLAELLQTQGYKTNELVSRFGCCNQSGSKID